MRLPGRRHVSLRAAAATTWSVLAAAVRKALAGHVTDIAASVAYYAFLAIPAVLLIAVGVFSLTAGDDTISTLVEAMEGAVPDAALQLIDDTLTRVKADNGSGAALAGIGIVIALWTASGAMNALMRGLNRVQEQTETRNLARQRGRAAILLAWVLMAAALSFVLLVLGPPLSDWVGDALGAPALVSRLWWSLHWPILIGGLFIAMAGILRLGPAGPAPRRGAVAAGALVAIAVWLAASSLFAVYTANFARYGAAWGSLSAVIVMLTWLWLSCLALLLGAQVEREVELRSGGRRGERPPAGRPDVPAEPAP